MERTLEGRTWVVTGANTGIGRVTAERLAGLGAHLILAGRSEERTRPVLDAIAEASGSAEFVPLDLADLASVRDAARAIRALGRPLHGLVNNAGLAASGGLTVQGFERTFGVNHLGPFVFTENLLDLLVREIPSRVVFVASKAHFRARGIDWDQLRVPARTPMGFPEYCVSKLCNVLYANELARRFEGRGLTTCSLHPGVVATDVWRELPSAIRGVAKLFMLSSREGARTSLFCATGNDTTIGNGRYFDRLRARTPSVLARDSALQDLLVAKSRAYAAGFLESLG